jgi:hypothetical protein
MNSGLISALVVLVLAAGVFVWLQKRKSDG